MVIAVVIGRRNDWIAVGVEHRIVVGVEQGELDACDRCFRRRLVHAIIVGVDIHVAAESCVLGLGEIIADAVVAIAKVDAAEIVHVDHLAVLDAIHHARGVTNAHKAAWLNLLHTVDARRRSMKL